MRVLAILFCQSHGILYVSDARVVGCQDEVHLFFLREFTETLGCHADVFHGRLDTFFRVLFLPVGQSHRTGGRRHQLHQAACAGPRYGGGVEVGLRIGQ